MGWFRCKRKPRRLVLNPCDCRAPATLEVTRHDLDSLVEQQCSDCYAGLCWAMRYRGQDPDALLSVKPLSGPLVAYVEA